jgi:hypothetical protein
MKNVIISILLSVLTGCAFGQAKFKPDEKYLEHSSKAFKYYENKDYQQSGLSYDSLFKNYKGEGLRSDKYMLPVPGHCQKM